MNGRLPRLTPLSILLAAAALMVLPDATRAQNSVPAAVNRFPVSAAASAAQSNVGAGAMSIGDRLLLQAIGQLERRSSVTAKLSHQISLGGQQLTGTGSYWQQGSGETLRVRLEIQIAAQNATMLQISNSRFLWIDRNLPTGRVVNRYDLRTLRGDPGFGGPASEPGQATWSTLEADLATIRGGLPSLLASLRENFTFLAPQAMRLAVKADESSPSTTIPVFAFAGHWKPEKLAELFPKAQKANGAGEGDGNSQAGFPERLPEEVLLLIGQADLFPYRIEYRKLETPAPVTRDQAVTYELSSSPLVVLGLSEVAFDVPIAAGHFDYAPGDADWADQTTTLLEQLRQRKEDSIALKDRNSPAQSSSK